MADIFNKIKELERVNQYSKHEQLVNGIINAIDEKVLVKGDLLPSVNNMVKELGFARKTIVKAYKELKDRGLVESKNRLGYYLANEATEQTIKVALLLYAFHPFQEMFYNTFRSAIGENIQLEVFFHHNNIEVFETIMNNVKGQYGMYVVAPIPHPRTKEILSGIPANKMLMIDRYEPLIGEFSHVTQEFEISTYMALKELSEVIRKFDHMVLFFRPNSDYPIEIRRAFEKFLEDNGLSGEVQTSYEQGSVKKGMAYFTIGDSDLWAILKDCKEKNLEIGEDVGIISNSEDTVKEIISGGITTNCTDFRMMAQRAADFVLNRTPMQVTIPTYLTRRKSL